MSSVKKFPCVFVSENGILDSVITNIYESSWFLFVVTDKTCTIDWKKMKKIQSSQDLTQQLTTARLLWIQLEVSGLLHSEIPS